MHCIISYGHSLWCVSSAHWIWSLLGCVIISYSQFLPPRVHLSFLFDPLYRIEVGRIFDAWNHERIYGHVSWLWRLHATVSRSLRVFFSIKLLTGLPRQCTLLVCHRTPIKTVLTWVNISNDSDQCHNYNHLWALRIHSNDHPDVSGRKNNISSLDETFFISYNHAWWYLSLLPTLQYFSHILRLPILSVSIFHGSIFQCPEHIS